jgi:CheY-like chemotaxis protein
LPDALQERLAEVTEERTAMTRTIICPYCQRPQLLEDTPRETLDEVHCENCGGVLRRGAAVPARPRTILWIDDDRLLLSACCQVLEAQGYRTLLATDGATGIELAQTERPDAILLDVVMPTMHGLEVCQQLRALPHLKDTPIILLTALEDAGVGTMGTKVGATTTLRKPFGPEYVVEFLAKVLGRQSGLPKL